MTYEPQTTLAKPHPAIQAALKVHSFCDPFTSAWLISRCNQNGQTFDANDFAAAIRFRHIERIPTTTPETFKKGANWKP